jgi:hypothetical protein
MRSKLLALSLVAAAAIAAPVARADRPIITPAPSADFVDTTSCAFPVTVHFTVNRETAKTFANGTTIITGPLFAQYSANGKSLTLDISGPGKLTISNGSALFIGHGVGAGPLVTPNGVILAYAAGRVTISTTPTLSATLLNGHVLLNICDALAP